MSCLFNTTKDTQFRAAHSKNLKLVSHSRSCPLAVLLLEFSPFIFISNPATSVEPVVLCYAMPFLVCYAQPCNAMQCHVMLCNAIRCYLCYYAGLAEAAHSLSGSRYTLGPRGIPPKIWKFRLSGIQFCAHLERNLRKN